MPYSARFVLALVILAILTAPASLFVQRRQEAHARRTQAALAAGGDTRAGEQAFLARRCSACHDGGPPGADKGQVGPSLKGLSQRTVIAGRLPNTPQMLAAWIEHPQRLSPGSAMPEQGVRPQESRDIAAFLLSRK